MKKTIDYIEIPSYDIDNRAYDKLSVDLLSFTRSPMFIHFMLSYSKLIADLEINVDNIEFDIEYSKSQDNYRVNLNGEISDEDLALFLLHKE